MKFLRKILGFLFNPRPRYQNREGGFSLSVFDTEDQAETTEPPGRIRLGHILTNIPLMLGSVIVLGLFLIVLFGPPWAPENP